MNNSKLNLELLTKIVNTISNPVFVKDRNHSLVFINRAMSELICNSYINDFLNNSSDELRALDEKVFNYKDTIESKEIFYDAEGKSKTFLVTRTYFSIDNDELIINTLNDITIQNEIQQNLEHAKKTAEEISKLKSNFVANVSHEIRTPMNGVLGMAEILLETDLNAEQREYIECMITSGKTLLAVVNDVLDYSKVECGKLSVNSEPFNLEEISKVVELSFRPQFNKRKVDIFIEIDKTLPPNLIGDSTRVLQIITNLIGNSLKFTLPEGIVLVSLKREKKDNQDQLAIYVFDSGIGIPLEKQNLVFEPFMQADSGVTRSFGGTGLGLSIVAKLVELMKGTIELRSKPRVGTVVKVEMPLVSASFESISYKEKTEDLDTKTEELNILVAEDNKVNQVLIRTILEQAGHKTVLVENGEQALKLNSTEKFDLILMDIQMPVLDGESATELIRRSRTNNNVPIIALTANAFKEDSEQYLSIGMNGYISKPISRQSLFDEIKRVKNLSLV